MKKPAISRVQPKDAEGARSHRTHEPKPPSETSRNHRQKTLGNDEADEKLTSDIGPGKTQQQESGEKGDGRSSFQNKGVDNAAAGRERTGERELPKRQAQSSGYKQTYQGKRGEMSSGTSNRDFNERWRSENHEHSRYERGRRESGRGRGRNQPDLEDYKPPARGSRFLEAVEHREPRYERGRERRGRGRGRRGRRNGDDDDAYQPSKPSAGYSLGDLLEQKLVLKEKPSYLDKYRDDYYYSELYSEWEESRDGYNDEKDHRHDEKSRTEGGFTKPVKEYPPMPSKYSTSRSSIGVHNAADGREKTGERELPKRQVQSSGYKQNYQGKRGEISSGTSDRDVDEECRSENYKHSRYERGRRESGRGRGRNQPDLEDYKSPARGSRYQEAVEHHDPRYERGRERRGKGRGRRGRQNGDDDDDDAYQASKPSAGYSLGDLIEQKLVLKEKPSYLDKYRDDYYYSTLYSEWEASRDGYNNKEDPRHGEKSKTKNTFRKPEEECSPMPSKYPASRATKQPTNQQTSKHSEDKRERTSKTAWAELEEDHPSMPSRSKKPMSQPQSMKSEDGEEGGGHWDWVGLAAGSSAPSTATKYPSISMNS